jgi:hypothetical protein
LYVTYFGVGPPAPGGGASEAARGDASVPQMGKLLSARSLEPGSPLDRFSYDSDGHGKLDSGPPTKSRAHASDQSSFDATAHCAEHASKHCRVLLIQPERPTLHCPTHHSRRMCSSNRSNERGAAAGCSPNGTRFSGKGSNQGGIGQMRQRPREASGRG